MRQLGWDGYVHLACDEIRLPAAGSGQVTRRFGNMLDAVIDVAPLDRRAGLEQQRQMLARGAIREFEEPEDIAFDPEGDQQGIGSGPSTRKSPDGLAL
jgi:hypothetical protein